MRKAAMLAAVVALVVLGACSDSSPEPTAAPSTPTPGSMQAANPPPTPTLPPQPTPTAVSPTATPPPTTVASAVPLSFSPPAPAPVAVRSTPLEASDVGQIVQALGYALVPGYVPEGLQPSRVLISGGRALIVYGDPEDRLFVAYPVVFPAEGFLVQGDPDSPKRPDDAVSEFRVAGGTGRLVRGQWSADTIMGGPAIDPDAAEWDYEATLTLFFDFELSTGDAVPVWIQARENPGEWIAGDGLARIAESLSPAE